MSKADKHFALFRLVSDFGSGKSGTGIRQFYGNPAKSGSGLISSRIWQIPHTSAVIDKTDTADCQVIYLQF